MTKKASIILMGESIVANDAVGNDLMGQLYCLQQQGYECQIYAQNLNRYYEKYRINKDEFLLLTSKPDTVIIFHHSTHWSGIMDLLEKTNCKYIMKYHNVTPNEFFAGFEPHYEKASKLGRQLTGTLVQSGKFDLYLADSPYNASELLALGAPPQKVKALAPFHKVSDFKSTPVNQDLFDKYNDQYINVLFVGRIVPNKGHRHLIKVISRYVEMFDNRIRLHIVGNKDDRLSKYFKQLKKEIRNKQLDEQILFHQTVPFTDLHTFYKLADVFLLMSEHEGFCVPVLEAQYNHLPLLALDKSAVKDTAGPDQLVFEQLDYDLFASAIRIIGSSNETRDFLIQQGYNNYLKYEHQLLASQFINTINSFAC